MGRNFDWRPYITADGKVQMYPSTLGNAFAPAALKARFYSDTNLVAKSMGFETDARGLAVESVQFEKGEALRTYLQSISSLKDSQILLRNFFTWLFATERSTCNQLMAMAIRHFEVDYEMSHNPRTKENYKKQNRWPQAIQRHAARLGVDFSEAPGVLVPRATQLHVPLKEWKYLSPKDVVSMKLLDINAANWKRSSEILPNDHFVAELVKI